MRPAGDARFVGEENALWAAALPSSADLWAEPSWSATDRPSGRPSSVVRRFRETRANRRSSIEILNRWAAVCDGGTLAIPMATAIPDFESMSLDELRRWSVIEICEADPRVLRATGSKDDFTNVLFVRITWKPGAIRASAHDPLLSVLQRVLSRWARRDWLVVVTDQPSCPPAPGPGRSRPRRFGQRQR